jgi:hypothetical protein
MINKEFENQICSVATVKNGEFCKVFKYCNIRINNDTIQRYLNYNNIININDGKVFLIVIDI